MATQSDGLHSSLLVQHYTLLKNSMKAECKICKKQICTINWNSLILHSSNHKSIETSYKVRSHNSIWQYFIKFEGYAKCSFCGSIISAAYRLIYHLERKHPEIANLVNAYTNTVKKITIRHDSNPYYRYLSKFKVHCKLCNKICSSNNIGRHLKKIHSHNTTNKKKIRNWIWQYLKIESYDKVSCNICDRIYMLSSGSTKHLKIHLSKCHNINAYSKIDENTKENKTHKAIRQLETKEDVADASIYQMVPYSKIEENEEGNWRFHQVNAYSTPDGNIEENKTDRGMKQLITKEDIIDISFNQTVLHQKIEENKEIKWRFHQVNAYSTPDGNIEENKMDRGMKQLITKEDIIDISFNQTILYQKIEENKENKWSSTNSSYTNFGGQILMIERDKVYSVL